MKYISPDARFKLRPKQPNPVEDQKRSWDKLVACIESNDGSANYDALIGAVRFHPAGAEGFVRYAIKNGWLVEI